MPRPLIPLLAAMLLVAGLPSLASADDSWIDTDLPSREAAARLVPVARSVSLFAGVPLLAAGATMALTAGPVTWSGAPTNVGVGLRVGTIAVLGSAQIALLVGHASGRVGRGFAGGPWDARPWTLMAGSILLGTGYGLTIGGLTSAALALPPVSLGLTLPGVAATVAGGTLLLVDALLSAGEIERHLAPSGAGVAQASGRLRIDSFWAVPARGGMTAGIGGRF